jgi:hypothetical protein
MAGTSIFSARPKSQDRAEQCGEGKAQSDARQASGPPFRLDVGDRCGSKDAAKFIA